jgi:hypothetical protein
MGFGEGRRGGIRGIIMDMIEATNRRGIDISRELIDEIRRFAGKPA